MSRQFLIRMIAMVTVSFVASTRTLRFTRTMPILHWSDKLDSVLITGTIETNELEKLLEDLGVPPTEVISPIDSS